MAVVSERRRHPLCQRMTDLGARAIAFQGVWAFSTDSDPRLRASTRHAVAAPIDELIVGSDLGFAAWLREARRWGLADALLERIRRARLLAANPRAADALRRVGFQDIWSTADNSTEDLIRYLMAQSLTDRRVVVQSDEVTATELCQALRGRGGEVVEVSTLQCLPPVRPEPLRRLGDELINAQVDAVVFTTPAAVDNLLTQAAADHRADAVLNALSDEIQALCVGRLTAAPLLSRGVPALHPSLPYLDELLALAAVAVPRGALRLVAGGQQLEVHAQAVVMGGRLIPVPPGPLAVLRALARQPGRVMSCADIRRETPAWADADDHAIEMAVSRLRRTLAGAEVVQTVMKRGYRLIA